jgi:hypothetical protein
VPSPTWSTRAVRIALVAVTTILVFGGNTAQPGPRWPKIINNFDVVGHLRLQGRAPEGDIYFFDHGHRGTYAYLGSVGCAARGVRIVRTTDPAHPRPIATARVDRKVDYQDAVVARIGDKTVMGVGLQPCGPTGRGGGVALFDVTRPREPRRLGIHDLPRFNGVHELDFAVRDDGTALALLAVPFAEANTISGGQNVGGDLQIIDISAPRRPRKLADWGVILDSSLPRANSDEPIESPGQGQGYSPEYFLHSVRSADDGLTAYASYWDGGELKFDLSDPANPTLVGRTVFPLDAEGEAHSMTPFDLDGTRYILEADEDFTPETPAIVTSNATGEDRFQAVEEFWMPTTLSGSGSRSGALFDAGDGCDVTDYEGAANDTIVLIDAPDPAVEQPVCSKVDAIVRAAKAGVETLVINWIGEDRPFTFPPGPQAIRRVAKHATEIVVVDVSSLDDLATRMRSHAGPVRVTLERSNPSWGFLRVHDESLTTDSDGDGIEEYTQVGTFDDLPHVSGEYPPEEPLGAWSIHNVEVHEQHAYISWYSHGIVALDMSDPSAPAFAGQFVPPSDNQRKRFLGRGPAQVWGVAIDRSRDLVYASDMRTGLWILRPTGPATP